MLVLASASWRYVERWGGWLNLQHRAAGMQKCVLWLAFSNLPHSLPGAAGYFRILSLTGPCSGEEESSVAEGAGDDGCGIGGSQEEDWMGSEAAGPCQAHVCGPRRHSLRCWSGCHDRSIQYLWVLTLRASEILILMLSTVMSPDPQRKVFSCAMHRHNFPLPSSLQEAETGHLGSLPWFTGWTQQWLCH